LRMPYYRLDVIIYCGKRLKQGAVVPSLETLADIVTILGLVLILLVLTDTWRKVRENK
jgi:hypothetical protein